MSIETILEAVRSSLESRQYDRFVDLFAEDGIYELPFALQGVTAVYSGIDSIRARFLEIAAHPINRLYELKKVNMKSCVMGGSTAVAELSIEGKMRTTGAGIAVSSSIALIELVSGKISRYRDYPNSAGIAQALGVLPQFLAALKA